MQLAGDVQVLDLMARGVAGDLDQTDFSLAVLIGSEHDLGVGWGGGFDSHFLTPSVRGICERADKKGYVVMLSDIIDEEVDGYRGEEGFRSLLPEVGSGFKGNPVAAGFNLHRSEVLDAAVRIGGT